MVGNNDGKLVGRVLGHYRLVSLLGTGGMAEVYRARDMRLPREVAVKVLPPQLASDPSYVQRFRSEARRVARLGHPNIVPVYEFGEEDDLLYLVMPLMRESLRDILSRTTRLPIPDALLIASQVAAALESAHEHGIVHRDVKPENVLLDDEGHALLTDFGISRELSFLRRPGSMQTLAATGLPVGTPEYMSPEQLRGGTIDQRADVYALGAMLYEMLTGRPPHEASTPYEVAALALTAQIVPPSHFNPDIPPALEATVLMALARNADRRYHSVAAMARALQAQGAGANGMRPTRPLYPGSEPDPLSELSTQVPLVGLAEANTEFGSAIRVPRRNPRTGRVNPRMALALSLAVAVVLVGSGVAVLRGLPTFGAPQHNALSVAASTATDTPLPTETPVPTATALPTATPSPMPTATPKPLGNSAAYLGTDSKTLGTWRGTYGSVGYSVFEDAGSLPPYIILAGVGENHYVWGTGQLDQRALQRAMDSNQRIAATWYSGGSNTYTIDVQMNDKKAHTLSLYCLDWDSTTRAQTVQILDATTNKVLSTQAIANYHNGIYLRWRVSGHIKIVLTRTGGYNAVASGIFFD